MNQHGLFLFLFLISGNTAFSQEPDTAKAFSSSSLTSKQRGYLERFRHAKKENRPDRFRKIQDIFPTVEWQQLNAQTMMMDLATVSFRMTRCQLVELLGPPDSEGNLLQYDLGPAYCAVNFGVKEDSGIYFAHYANCRF